MKQSAHEGLNAIEKAMDETDNSLEIQDIIFELRYLFRKKYKIYLEVQ